MAVSQDQQNSPQIDPISPPEFVERRAYPRHAVDCAVRITLISGAGEVLGRVCDLSLGGCLVATDKRLGIGIQARVEVMFQLRGLCFRLAGVTVSTRNANAFAIRFLHVPAHRQEELAAALGEEGASNAILPAPVVPKPSTVNPEIPPIATVGTALKLIAKTPSPNLKEQLAQSSTAIVRAASAPASTQDRRSSSRHAVDTRANLLLVKTGITMPGRILNLSLGGCQIRMEERFNVGIYVRVEAEFFLHGLPFRIGGVSQAIIDKFTIGIRFLDMSERRRHQLEELIEEIAEAKAKGFDPTAIAVTPAQESQ